MNKLSQRQLEYIYKANQCIRCRSYSSTAYAVCNKCR